MIPSWSGPATRSAIQPGHAPHSPEGRRIRERVAADAEEVSRPAFDDATGLAFPDQLSAADRRGRECLPRLQTGLDKRLHLPPPMVRAKGTAAETETGRD